MDVTINVYRVGSVHKLTVVARPHVAASLGEHVLIEARPLGDLTPDCTASEAMSAAYREIAVALARRRGVDGVASS